MQFIVKHKISLFVFVCVGVLILPRGCFEHILSQPLGGKSILKIKLFFQIDSLFLRYLLSFLWKLGINNFYIHYIYMNRKFGINILNIF